MEINPIVPYQGEKYKEYIKRIKKSRENKKYKFVYMEYHHIKPKCDEGPDTADNLVWLLAQEHFYAHRLLWESDKHNSKYIGAYWSMGNMTVNGRRHVSLTPQEYAQIRELWHKNHPSARKVLCIEKGIVFDSAVAAARDIGVSKSLIHSVCCSNATNCTAKGYHYIYEDDISPEKINELLAIKPSVERRKIQVVCVETGEVFNSIVEAANFINRPESTIRAVLSGRIETSRKDKNGKGYHWKYLDESDKGKRRITKTRKAKRVICTTTGEIFNSYKEVMERYSVKEVTLRDNLRKTHKVCGVIINRERKKYNFDYLED